MSAAWQVYDLASDDDPMVFHVARAPVVPATVVQFSRIGLELLARGLRGAGLRPRLRRDSDRLVVLPTLRCERAALSGPDGLLASLRGAFRASGCTVSPGNVRLELADAGLA